MKWELPPFDYYKLNVDGAMFCDLQKSGIGWVVCDHGGKVLLAASLVERNVPVLETMEAFWLSYGASNCACIKDFRT